MVSYLPYSTKLASIEANLTKASAQLEGEREAHKSTKARLANALKDFRTVTGERDDQAAEVAKFRERCTAVDSALKRAEQQCQVLVSEKDQRISEQGATMRELTAALKRLQIRKRKTG